jgi:hypothetical protein
VSVEVTGPFAAWKVLGARLSLADRGLTFGTVPSAGVCVSFRDPVSGIEPTGRLRHPNLTVTVAQPDCWRPGSGRRPERSKHGPVGAEAGLRRHRRLRVVIGVGQGDACCWLAPPVLVRASG